jgi:spore coat protein U-like protein
VKSILRFIATLAIISVTAGIASAAVPLGFATATLTVNAQVGASCQEAQHGSFPDPLTIDTQSAVDQTFSPTADELIKCTGGTVFTIKVSSGNGTAVNQTCTVGGVSNMALKSTGFPADTIAYTFLCSGDTDGSGHFTGAGFSTARALGMSIKVLAANAQAAVAHADYADSVILTISY